MTAESEDWKAKLKALGIRRTRRTREAREPDRRKLETGAGGEELAARHLAGSGCSILDRNVRYRGGELDLVAEEREFLVFVEVRTRRTGASGSALESVTARKRARVVRAARLWLARHPREAGRPVRFDVVAVDGEPPTVEWVRGAFDAS
ncbi:MAG: YraN family protein [Thermoanaerobaculia bacterium]